MKLWQKLSEKRIRLNRYRSMLKMRFRLPNGYTGDFYLNDIGTLVCALVLTRDRKVVLARQFRAGLGRILTELPAGGVGPNESPRVAIQREVLEETGYRGKIRFIGKSNDDAWSKKIRYHYIITDAVWVREPQNECSEMTEVVLMSLPKFRQHIRSANLSDSETAYRTLDALHLL
ncbi:MAG: NUDIX hydrolase [Candidatus Kerfeldbacteria bacterium]